MSPRSIWDTLETVRPALLARSCWDRPRISRSAKRAVVGADLNFDLPDPLYVARTGAASVEADGRLEPLVKQLAATWKAGSDDVVVWELSAGRYRLVAVLRDSRGGPPLVTWL